MRKLLLKLKWILLPVTVVVWLAFIEAATDVYGISSDESGLGYCPKKCV